MSASDTKGRPHLPVMVDEVVDLLRPVPTGVIVDATVGAGGHAKAILTARPDVPLLGLDRDPAALDEASAAIAQFGDRATLVHARFDTLADVVRAHGHDGVAGVLFDLGVSSMQLDRGDRGFSYWADGPLDMRMDPSGGASAADIVNGYSAEELAGVISRYGDERFAARIARAMVKARPLATTTELAEVVRDAIPAPARRRGGHPARRAFQALRIEVNGELDSLPAAVDQAIEVLLPGGRAIALAYHSGEDRIVKERFRLAETGGCTCLPRLPCACGAVSTVRLLRRGALKPSTAEIEANRRAGSARLRAIEKLEVA